MKRAIALSSLFLLACVGLLGAEPQRRVFQQNAPPVVVVAAAEPGKPGDGSLHKHVLLHVVKHRVIAKLMREGLNGKKHTQAEAEAAYAKLTPEMIDGAIAEGGPQTVAQLGMGGRLANFLQWLSDHSAEIMQIVTLILKILALFA